MADFSEKNLIKKRKVEKIFFHEGREIFFGGLSTAPGGAGESPPESEQPQTDVEAGDEAVSESPDTSDARREVAGDVAGNVLEKLEKGSCENLAEVFGELEQSKELTLTGLGNLESELIKAFEGMFKDVDEELRGRLKEALDIDNLEQLEDLYTVFAKKLIERKRYPDFIAAYNQGNENPVDPNRVQYRIVLNGRGLESVSISAVGHPDLEGRYGQWVDNVRREAESAENVDAMIDRFKGTRAGRFLLSFKLVDEEGLRNVLSGEGFDILAAISCFLILGRDSTQGIFGEVLEVLPERVRQPFEGIATSIRGRLEEGGFLGRGERRINAPQAFSELLARESLNEDLRIETPIELEGSVVFRFDSGDRKIEIPAGARLQSISEGSERSLERTVEMGTEDDGEARRIVLTGTIPRGTVFRGISKIEAVRG